MQTKSLSNSEQIEHHDCLTTMQKLIVCRHHVTQCCALIAVQNGWDSMPTHAASNLVLLKSVRRLRHCSWCCDLLMDTDENGMWAQTNMQGDCMRSFSGGNLCCTLCHGGNRHDQWFTFESDICGNVGTHVTFLCIPSTPFVDEVTKNPDAYDL